MEKNWKLLAFDADDTLWDCQSHFDEVEKKYADILKPYGDGKKVSEELFKTESGNMELLGYGCKAFTISLVENAVKMSNGKIPADDILKITELGKSLLQLDGKPLNEVRETLKSIRQMDKYSMVVFTKGELLDQENKMKRSGLTDLFDDVIVVSDKTKESYRKLCTRFDTDIKDFMMIGNSFKSDIEPVLKLGGWAVHIPFHTIWQHEKIEEYDHQKLFRIAHFGELTEILK